MHLSHFILSDKHNLSNGADESMAFSVKPSVRNALGICP